MGLKLFSLLSVFYLLNFSSLFLLTNGQLEEMTQLFANLYQNSYNKFGQKHMEGIQFTQQVYDFEAIDGEEFDFVVVGAGPSGCALTHRLSENRFVKVLLLEAGIEPPVLNDIPWLLPAWSLTPYNWNYKLEKDPSFGRGLENGQISYSSGKGLGGTTLINYMLFTRGNKEDYDEIERLGNKGWSWKDVEPIFKSLENTMIDFQDYELRGHRGLVNCDEWKNRTIVGTGFVEACQRNGLPYVDYNGRSQIGTSFAQVTTRNGLRLSAEKAYLRPVKNRPNLKILTRSLVTKVLFNKNNEAIGVEFTRDGVNYVAKASKEVILSAGALKSPQLLLQSGIGPKKDLQKLGIRTIYDSPVGKTMYDHLSFFGLIFECRDNITLQPFDNYEMDELVAKGVGNIANPLVESLTFFQTKQNIKDKNKNKLTTAPDMEFIFFPGDFSSDKGSILRRCFSVTDEMYNNFYKLHEGKNVFIVIPMHLHPKAKGSVSLRSSNPFDAPILKYPFLNNREDVQAFIKAIRFAIDIVKEEPLKGHGCKQVSTVIPGCEDFEFDSDDYWECGVRTLGLSLFHQVGTCRMGPKWDKEAVVDNKGRVYGVKKLRVADPSIIPVKISSHTQVPAYMIGEKIAFDLKKEYLIKNNKDW